LVKKKDESHVGGVDGEATSNLEKRVAAAARRWD